MKITRFDLLWGPFLHRDQASRRESKIMQNDAKMHVKSPQNEHEKILIPILQWSKTHAVAWPAKMHQITFIFVAPDVTLLAPWMQKLFKIVENSLQNDHKKCEARCCCSFANSIHPKYAQNPKPFNYCYVPVVVPAARRANSECITQKIKYSKLNLWFVSSIKCTRFTIFSDSSMNFWCHPSDPTLVSKVV